MGRHDKREVISVEINPIEWYIERNKTLTMDNVQLRKKIDDLEKAAGITELAMDHQEEISAGIMNELKEELADKDDEIRELKYQVEQLKEAVVLAALREV